jgi:large subunit ribosomal protein L30e
LALVVKSGKFEIGYTSVLKTLRKGKAKLVVISKNCPPLRKSELEYYAMLSQSAVHHFHGTNTDLGVASGKVFRTSVIAVTDQGDSDILASLAK